MRACCKRAVSTASIPYLRPSVIPILRVLKKAFVSRLASTLLRVFDRNRELDCLEISGCTGLYKVHHRHDPRSGKRSRAVRARPQPKPRWLKASSKSPRSTTALIPLGGASNAPSSFGVEGLSLRFPLVTPSWARVLTDDSWPITTYGLHFLLEQFSPQILPLSPHSRRI
jgi:hypothetical protein